MDEGTAAACCSPWPSPGGMEGGWDVDTGTGPSVAPKSNVSVPNSMPPNWTSSDVTALSSGISTADSGILEGGGTRTRGVFVRCGAGAGLEGTGASAGLAATGWECDG